MIANRAEILVYLGKASTATEADVALIDMLIPMCEATVCDYMQNELERATHIEYLPIGQPVRDEQLLSDDVEIGSNSVRFISGDRRSSALQLKHTPVLTTGLEVREQAGARAGTVSGSFGSDTVLVNGTDYFLDVDDPSQTLSRSGLIHRVGEWPTEARSVKVTYLGGFTDLQFAGKLAGSLKLAMILTVVKEFKQAKALSKNAGPVMSESIGKYSVSTGGPGAAMFGGMSVSLAPQVVQLLFPLKNLGRLFA